MKMILAAVVVGVMQCGMAFAGQNAMDVLVESAGSPSVAAVVKLPVPAPAASGSAVADSRVTVAMDPADIPAVIGIFNRVQVKAVAQNADCSASEAVIESRVRSFNPAKWSILSGDIKAALTQTEIPSMITMFNRLQVAVNQENSIDLRSIVTIKSRVCNLRPAVWTVTYNKAQ